MKGYFGFELLHQDLCTGEHHRFVMSSVLTLLNVVIQRAAKLLFLLWLLVLRSSWLFSSSINHHMYKECCYVWSVLESESIEVEVDILLLLLFTLLIAYNWPFVMHSIPVINRHDKRVLYCKSESLRDKWVSSLQHAAHVVPIEVQYLIFI